MSFTRDYERPLNWQDFEDLTQGMFRVVYDDVDAQKNGRAGQAQAGVDVYGRDRDGMHIGIQCKKLDETGPGGEAVPGGVLTLRQIKDEIQKAELFQPGLGSFVMATTAKTDVKMQAKVRKIDESRRANGDFGVTTWYWEFFNGWLNNEASLQQWYYKDVLHTRHPETTDRFILETFHMAFSRNAFRDPIGREEPQPFLKAIEDTQRALNTGELRDRETKAVIRKAPGGCGNISSPEFQKQLKLVQDSVAEVRKVYKDARDSNPPGLIEHVMQVQIIDPLVGPRLDELRADAIRHLNEVLKDAEVPLVNSPLL